MILIYFPLLSFFTSPEKFGKATEYLSLQDISDFYVQDKARRNDASALSSQIKAKTRDYSALDLWVKGVKPQNLISFTPHNKVGYGTEEFNLKHPTVKPIALMEYLIALCTNEGDVILDMFMGTGSTGIAARNLNREFIGCEIDSAYFAIAENRIKAPPAGLFFQ